MERERVEVDPVFLVYAFRYALGRRSYSVSDVAETLIAERAALRPQWRAQIATEIEEAITAGRAGDPCDVDRWRAVQAAM